MRLDELNTSLEALQERQKTIDAGDEGAEKELQLRLIQEQKAAIEAEMQLKQQAVEQETAAEREATAAGQVVAAAQEVQRKATEAAQEVQRKAAEAAQEVQRKAAEAAAVQQQAEQAALAAQEAQQKAAEAALAAQEAEQKTTTAADQQDVAAEEEVQKLKQQAEKLSAAAQEARQQCTALQLQAHLKQQEAATAKSFADGLAGVLAEVEETQKKHQKILDAQRGLYENFKTKYETLLREGMKYIVQQNALQEELLRERLRRIEETNALQLELLKNGEKTATPQDELGRVQLELKAEKLKATGDSSLASSPSGRTENVELLAKNKELTEALETLRQEKNALELDLATLMERSAELEERMRLEMRNRELQMQLDSNQRFFALEQDNANRLFQLETNYSRELNKQQKMHHQEFRAEHNRNYAALQEIIAKLKLPETAACHCSLKTQEEIDKLIEAAVKEALKEYSEKHKLLSPLPSPSPAPTKDLNINTGSSSDVAIAAGGGGKNTIAIITKEGYSAGFIECGVDEGENAAKRLTAVLNKATTLSEAVDNVFNDPKCIIDKEKYEKRVVVASNIKEAEEILKYFNESGTTALDEKSAELAAPSSLSASASTSGSDIVEKINKAIEEEDDKVGEEKSADKPEEKKSADKPVTIKDIVKKTKPLVSLKLKTTGADKSELIFYSDRGLTVSTNKGTIEIYKNGKITFRDDDGNPVSNDNDKNKIFKHGIDALAFKAMEALNPDLQKSDDGSHVRKAVYAEIVSNNCTKNVNTIFQNMDIRDKSDKDAKDAKDIQETVLEALQAQAQLVEKGSAMLRA